MKILTAFIRLTPAGSFELVTWTKEIDGTKKAIKEPTTITQDQALKIAASKYQEITLNNQS